MQICAASFLQSQFESKEKIETLKAELESDLKHCAEVFFTSSGFLLFHCILCENVQLTDIKELCKHLTNEHQNEITKKEFSAKTDDNTSDFKSQSSTEELEIIEEIVEINANDRVEVDSNEELSDRSVEADFDNTEELNLEETFWNCNESADDLEHASLEEKNTKNCKFKAKKCNLKDLQKPKAQQNAEERKFICDICKFGFKEKSNMLAHKRRHTGEKDHQCFHCPKKFYTRSERKAHMCFHTRERPFICSTCGRGFLTSGVLSAHMRRHTNDRPFKCEYCGKRFFDRSQLKEHTVSHTQERKHICEICSSAFLLPKTLRQHMKIHANKREYVCHICSAAFNQSPALSSHMKTHGEKLSNKKTTENIK